MKKLVFAVLALSLLLSGCGGKQPAPAPAVPTPEAAQPADPDLTEPPAASEAESLRWPELLIGTEVYQTYAVQGDYLTSTILQSRWPVAALTEASRMQYPALAAALDDFTKTEHSNGMNLHTMREEAARYDYEAAPERFEYRCYALESDAVVTRADNLAVSMCLESWENTGGIHPMFGWGAVTFDTQTGRQLTLEDVLPHQDGLNDRIIDAILAQTDAYSREELETALSRTCYPRQLTWTLGYDHMTFYFGDYELGSYAQGSVRVPVSFKALEGLIDPIYTASADNWILPMQALFNNEVFVDLAGDGVMHTISVSAEDVGEVDESFDRMLVWVDGKEAFSGDYPFYGMTPYLVRTADGIWLYVVTEGETSVYLNLFTLNGETADWLGSQEIYPPEIWLMKSDYGYTDYEDDDSGMLVLQIPTDPAHLTMSGISYLLGMCETTCSYIVGEDGALYPTRDWYVYRSGVIYELQESVEADVVDPVTREKIDTVQLDAGTDLEADRTDEKTWVDFRLEDGRICRFAYQTTREGTELLNDREVEDLFSSLYWW